MPNYGTFNPPACLYPGSKGVAFSAAQPAVPQASAAFGLWHPTTGNYGSFSVEIQFSAAPGVFEIDVQASDTDTDLYYENVTSGTITSVDANNHTRAEFVNIRANYVRLLLKTRTNAVSLTATINV